MPMMKTNRSLALTLAAFVCAQVLLPILPGPSAAHGERYMGNTVTYPAEADGLVPLMDAPGPNAVTIALLPGGVLVWLYGKTAEPMDGYYQVALQLIDAESGTEGYIAQDQLQNTDELQKLFEVAAVTPAPGRQEMTFSYAPSYWPGMKKYTQAMGQGDHWPVWEIVQMAGQMLYVSKDQEGGITVLPGDCTVWAKVVPQGKRFGIVVTPELTRRQTLWQGPGEDSTELGQYYSGMQAEILGEEGTFWNVRLGGKEGYLAKEALREVLVWEGKPK